jgi:von Willebrand factor type A domain
MPGLSTIDEVYAHGEGKGEKGYQCARMVVTADDDDEPWLAPGAAPADEEQREKRITISLRTEESRARELARKAESRMAELSGLLGKLKTTGTATRAEMDRAARLDEEIEAVARDAADSMARAKGLELDRARAVTGRKTAELLRAIKTRDIQEVILSVRAAESVDLAFVIDATGSMAPHIASVKSSIRSIVAKIKKTNPDLTLRLAAVAYRDLSDGKERSESLGFVPSVGEFEEFLQTVKAKGGGDEPEDMALGIQIANGLAWKNRTRVVFVIADAPCHGREFHNLEDNYPSGTPSINISGRTSDP